MNKSIWIGILVVILLIIGGVWLSQSGSETNEPRVVKVATFLKAIDYAPFVVAREKGWLKEAADNHNASLEYTEFQSLPPVNEAFANKNIDFVLAAEVPAIVGQAAGIDVQIVQPLARLDQVVLVRKGLTVNSVKDLKGKKIAVLMGTSPHYTLVKKLSDNGLSTKDVELIDMIPPNAKAAFESGQVDGWAIWPPFIEQEEVAGFGTSLKLDDVYTQVVVLGRGEFVSKNQALTKELLGTLERARTWIKENPEEAQQLMATETGLSADIVNRAWSKIDFGSKIDQSELEDIQNKADFFYSLGFIKNQVKATDVVWSPNR